MLKKTKKPLKIFLIHLIFLFLATQISSLDMIVQSGQDILLNETRAFSPHEGPYQICSGIQRAIPIIITNKASAITNYKFSLDGEKWAALSGNALALHPNQQGILYLILSPTGIEGNFTAKLNVLNERAKTKAAYPIKIELEECYSIALELSKEEGSLCSCEAQSYELAIGNNGRFTETVNLTTEMAGWINLSQSSVSLGPDGKTTVKLNVKADCDAAGNYPIRISAFLSSHPSIKAESLLSLGVINKADCYKAGIIARDISTDYSGIVALIKIKNTGKRPATYNISLDAPDWVKIMPSSLALNPSKTAALTIIAAPTGQIAADSYPATIKLASNGAEYAKTISIHLGKKSEFAKKIAYYRYYIYSIIILIIIFFLAYKLVKNRIKKHKLAPGKIKKRPYAGFKFLYYLLVAVIILGIAAYSAIRYGLFGNIKDLIAPYKSSISLGIKILAVLFVFMLLIAKRKKIIGKKDEKAEAEKKAEKKPEKVERVKGRLFKKLIFVLPGLVILAGIAYSFVYYGLYDYAKDFLITYYRYILVGIITLAVLIVVIRFYKPIIDFLMQKDSKR